MPIRFMKFQTRFQSTHARGQMSRLSSLRYAAAATAFVVVLVLEGVLNILVKNFRFTRTNTRARTRRIRLDRMHTPCAFSYFPHSAFQLPNSRHLNFPSPP